MLILLCRDLLFIFINQKLPEGIGFFISDNLTFEQRPGLLIDEPGKLESTFIEIILPSKRNVIYGYIYKHPSMKISSFTSEYLTSLLINIQKDGKTCMLMYDLNVNLFNAETKTNISGF